MPRHWTGPGRRARESSPTKAGIAEVGELVEGRDDGGEVIAGVVVDRARRRCRFFDRIAGSMPPVDVVRGRRGDAVSGSDAVVRYREGYFSGPGARLDVVAAAFVPDRVQIFFGRGLLLSQPVAGRGGLSEVLAPPRRIWPAEKCGSPPTVSQPACVHLDRPARSGERAGQNVGRRLGDFGCAQPAPEDDAGRRIVTAGRTAELGAPPRCRRRCPRWEIDSSGATSAGRDRRVRTARRAGGRLGRSRRPRRRRARRRRPRRRRVARTGRPRRG